MKIIYNSFLRNIGRILSFIFVILILYLLSIIFDIKPKFLFDDTYALNSGYTNSTYYVAFQDCGYLSSSTSCVAGYGTWFGPENLGTSIQNPHNQNPTTYPFNYYQTRYQWRFFGGSTYTYKKGNKYTIKITFRTTYNNLSELMTYWKVDHIYGSTTNSSSNQSESFISFYDYILEDDGDLSTDNRYILTVNLVPTQDINYISIYFSLLDNSSRFITSYGLAGNMITYSNIPITYVVNEDIAIKDAINNQTKAINNNFNSLEALISASTNATNNLISSITTSQDETNDLIKDDSIDSNQANSYFQDFSQNNYGIQDIINVPLGYIQRLATESCSPLIFTLPFVNNSVSLPCMDTIYRTYFNGWYSVYQTLMFGVVAYGVCIKVMREVRDALNPMSTGRVRLINL